MRAAWLVVLGACKFHAGLGAAAGDAPVVDAPDTSDAPGDGPGVPCYGTGLGVQVCFAIPPSGPLLINQNVTINTSPGSQMCSALVGPTANDVCAIGGTSVTISSTVIGVGSRPLVIVSLGMLTLNGTVDVSSRSTAGSTRTGAGANPASCPAPNATASTGGGAGGSFGTQGGDGGDGGLGVLGGTAGAAVVPTRLRGGCPGGTGLDFNGGFAGQGGGAVDLIASSITVAGTINASGSAGGGAGITRNGGHGGGSGGMIVFDAPSLTIAGPVYANGGGGGGGSSGSPGSSGGDPLAWDQGGGGGAGAGGNAGDGGTGAHGTTAAENGANADNTGDGGGGGAGGAGVIRVFQAAVPTGREISPPPS